MEPAGVSPRVEPPRWDYPKVGLSKILHQVDSQKDHQLDCQIDRQLDRHLERQVDHQVDHHNLLFQPYLIYFRSNLDINYNLKFYTNLISMDDHN